MYIVIDILLFRLDSDNVVDYRNKKHLNMIEFPTCPLCIYLFHEINLKWFIHRLQVKLIWTTDGKMHISESFREWI